MLDVNKGGKKGPGSPGTFKKIPCQIYIHAYYRIPFATQGFPVTLIGKKLQCAYFTMGVKPLSTPHAFAILLEIC